MIKKEQLREIIKDKLDVDVVTDKSQHRINVDARTIFCYCCFKYLNEYTTTTILGKYLGKDHSTISIALSKIHSNYKTDKSFKKKFNIVVSEVEEQLKTQQVEEVKDYEVMDDVELKYYHKYKNLRKKYNNLQRKMYHYVKKC